VSCTTLSVKITQRHPLGRLRENGRNLIPSLKQIGALARRCRLFVRTPRKILPEHLLGALLAAIAFGERSARAIALELGIYSDTSVSRQAVWKRLRMPGITTFMEAIIGHALQRSLEDNQLLELRDSIQNLAHSVIQRVLVGDASTFTMHPSLTAFFPGSKNGKPVPKAHLKLQLITDLLTGRWIHFSIDAYGRSDAKAALDYMPHLRAGDLLIRDLGYACMESFRAIIAARAFFISRLKARVYVLDLDGKRLALRETLRRLAPNPGDIARVPVLMTESHRVPCEMIALRVPQSVADERRRKLKTKHKEQGFKAPSDRYLQLQDWTILVTNLEESQVSSEEALRWYLMRWRIELIFKACKSHTGMLKIVGHKTNRHHAKALVLTWVLAMILLAHRGAFEMARLTRETSSSSNVGPPLEIEICPTSIFKSMGRLMLSFGFQIELLGSSLDLTEHNRRMSRYFHQHNQTEETKGRTALFQILQTNLIG
jgi:hypothetical protein